MFYIATLLFLEHEITMYLNGRELKSLHLHGLSCKSSEKIQLLFISNKVPLPKVSSTKNRAFQPNKVYRLNKGSSTKQGAFNQTRYLQLNKMHSTIQG